MATKTDFVNDVVKRRAQYELFKNIHAKTCLGLAGPNPEEYVELLKSHARECILCDFNPSRNYVLHNSLCGAYDLNSQKVDWVDADFCTTIDSNKDDLEYLFKKLKKNKKEFYLSFNFSIDRRKDIGKEGSLQMLFDIFGEFDLEVFSHTTYPGLEGKQYIIVYKEVNGLQLIQYNATGTHMFSGVFHYVEPSEEETNEEPKKEITNEGMRNKKTYEKYSKLVNDLVQTCDSFGRYPSQQPSWVYYLLTMHPDSKLAMKVREMQQKYRRVK